MNGTRRCDDCLHTVPGYRKFLNHAVRRGLSRPGHPRSLGLLPALKNTGAPRISGRRRRPNPPGASDEEWISPVCWLAARRHGLQEVPQPRSPPTTPKGGSVAFARASSSSRKSMLLRRASISEEDRTNATLLPLRVVGGSLSRKTSQLRRSCCQPEERRAPAPLVAPRDDGVCRYASTCTAPKEIRAWASAGEH